MSEDVSNRVHEYVESIAESLRIRHDSRGNPIGDLLPAEFAAISEYILAIAECSTTPLRYALGIGAEARKHIVVFGGILPLIAANANDLGRGILFVAPDSRGESRAHLEYRAMMVLSTKVQFASWDDLQPKPENGFQMANLNQFWVIGDLDWSAHPIGSEYGELKRAAIQRVLADEDCPALLLHQQDKTPVIPFHPGFNIRF